jgi:hypothetical protein
MKSPSTGWRHVTPSPVKSRKQAIAIGLSEARKKGKKEKKKKGH